MSKLSLCLFLNSRLGLKAKNDPIYKRDFEQMGSIVDLN